MRAVAARKIAKMKIKLNAFRMVFYAVFFTSFDPGLINKYVVENESDYSVEASFRLQEGHRILNATDTIHTIKIYPKSKIGIIEYGEIGVAHDKKQHFLEAFDTISIRSTGKPIRKNIRERRNWKYQVINEGLLSLDEVEYRLVLNNEDFNQKKN